jgi:curved DNA-binding protein CbpA
MSSATSNDKLNATPRLVPGVDVRRLTLTPKDGFVLSRIDGQTTAKTLADVVAMSVTEVLASLDRLQAAGAVEWTSSAATPTGSRADPALSERCDLPLDERKVILEIERRLPSLSYWDLLELYGDPSAAIVKHAYFAQSRRYHPDRYFGKELGSFKSRLETIFKNIRTAYEVLSDDAERARYAAGTPPPKKPTPLDGSHLIAAPAAAKLARTPVVAPPKASDADLERRRQLIIEQRRQKRTGGSFSLEQAELLVEEGKKLLAAGDAAGAASAFRRASGHDPTNAEYQRLFREAKLVTDKARVAQLADDGDRLSAAGQWRAAAERYAQAFELVPAEVGFAVRAAELFLDSRNLSQAWDVTQQALAMAPRRRDVRLIAARILEERGDIAGALLQLNTVISIEGSDPHLDKLVDRLASRAR